MGSPTERLRAPSLEKHSPLPNAASVDPKFVLSWERRLHVRRHRSSCATWPSLFNIPLSYGGANPRR